MAESHSCRVAEWQYGRVVGLGGAELHKERVGGGGGVAGECRVAELLSCRIADGRIAELQRWWVAELGSCRVREFRSCGRYRVTDLQSGIRAKWQSRRAVEVQCVQL